MRSKLERSDTLMLYAGVSLVLPNARLEANRTTAAPIPITRGSEENCGVGIVTVEIQSAKTLMARPLPVGFDVVAIHPLGVAPLLGMPPPNVGRLSIVLRPMFWLQPPPVAKSPGLHVAP